MAQKWITPTTTAVTAIPAVFTVATCTRSLRLRDVTRIWAAVHDTTHTQYATSRTCAT